MAQYKAAIKCGAPVSCLSCFLLSTKINIPMYTHNNNAGRHFYDNKVHIEPKGAGFSVAFFHSLGSFVNISWPSAAVSSHLKCVLLMYA